MPPPLTDPDDEDAPPRVREDTQAPHPYDVLTPDRVVDALAAVGLHGDGRLMALGSYENRVYLAQLEEPYAGHASVVVKFYRPERWSDEQILEEHAFAAELIAAEVPLVGPLLLQGRTLHHHAGFAFSVSPRRGGRMPELEDPDVLEWIGRFLARLHAVGQTHAFVHRPALDVASFGVEPRDWLLDHGILPLDVEADWRRRCDEALGWIRERTEQLQDGQPPVARIRLHGDCHPGNILWTPDEGPHFVDLDDARMGPAVQDLWMLLTGERDQQRRQLAALLDGYEQLRAFDPRELAWIEPLRTLRQIHYSAWLARRWSDPAFPRAFPWFGSSDYWRGQVQMLEDQIEAMETSVVG